MGPWTYFITLSLNLSSASLVGAAVVALFQNGYNNCAGRLPLEKLFAAYYNILTGGTCGATGWQFVIFATALIHVVIESETVSCLTCLTFADMFWGKRRH